MWSWGEGLALGHGGGSGSWQLLPKVIEGLPAGTRIRRFAAGGYSVVCELGDDSLWSWGGIAGSKTSWGRAPMVVERVVSRVISRGQLEC